LLLACNRTSCASERYPPTALTRGARAGGPDRPQRPAPASAGAARWLLRYPEEDDEATIDEHA